jgi:hypothetical protein
LIEVKSAGRPVKESFEQIQPAALAQETWQWRAAHLTDMAAHARFSPAAAGQHEAGVNTFGGQESAAAKSDNAQLPALTLWKTADEKWARQVLKLAADNWLDERVNAVEGLNGKWEFQKLKGSALNLELVHIITRTMPIDPSQQDSLSQAVASGLLDPTDPRVKRKAMELYHLPRELDPFYAQQKRQWKEIEQMRAGQMVQPMLIRDNDAVHIETCQEWLLSDEADDNPQMAQLVLRHAQMHIINMAKAQQMQAVVQGAGAQAQAMTSPQPQAPPQQGGPKQPGGQEKGKQAGKHGGQVPPNPVERQQRATKGAQAKPNRPQPSSGNQHAVQRLT